MVDGQQNNMNIITILQSVTLLSLVKVLILILLGVYGTFAFLMMRQIRAMTRAVVLKDDLIIQILGIGHFVAAVLILFIAIVVL